MRAVAAVVAAALLVVSCGSGDEGSTATTPTPQTTTSSPTPTTAAETAGCGTATATGTRTETLNVSGVERSYLLTVPAAYRDDRPAPLVFDFHGLGANAEVQSRYAGLDAYAAARGYIVITPTGSGNDQHAYWILPNLAGGKDVSFFDALRAHAESTLCINPTRVYAVGISNGGAFASGLACDPARTFAGIATVSGLSPCRNSGPAVPVIAFHGTGDPIYPYDGGQLGGASDPSDRRPRLRAGTGTDASDLPTPLRGLQLPPVEDTVAQWAIQNGCDVSPKRSSIGTDVEVRTYNGCRADVVFYRIDGGGHSWPGASADVPLGPTTHTIDANELIVAFFDAH